MQPTSLTASFFFLFRIMWNSLLNIIFFWQGTGLPAAQPGPSGQTEAKSPTSPSIPVPPQIQVDFDPQAVPPGPKDAAVEPEAWSAPVEAELERLDGAIEDVRQQVEKALAGRPQQAHATTESLRVKLKGVVARLSTGMISALFPTQY
jgi:hypothetical protein